eukprot:TRINITY_DN13798_c0_g1_i1.p1 TRINITY_DN13798_c0_g1~~TRINITY_DN13798_c0_g1_i1.p1  ORF type:complete len:200 (-),score=31.88 TRINITY_DN13798_c0_g1_i1:68-667(-)
MEIKPVGQGTINFVQKNYWDSQIRNPLHCPYSIFAVHQIKPHKGLIDDFEEKRTELTKKVPKVKVVWGYYGAPLNRINEVLSYGWYRALNGAAVNVYSDPSEAIPYASDKVLLLCRLALGNGTDHRYDETTTKYTFTDGRQLMPAWLITFAPDQYSQPQTQNVEVINVGYEEQNITLNAPKSSTHSNEDDVEIEVDVNF